MTMATRLKFDELNKLGSPIVKKSKKPMPIPYKEFFGAMYITPDRMRSRIELAEEIEDVMLYVFAYWIIAAEAELSISEIKQDAKAKLTDVIAKHTKLDPYLEQHIDKVIDEVVDATERNAKLDDSDDSDDSDNSDYWTSQDRAMLIAENEANSFDNYVDYREATASGKTKKVSKKYKDSIDEFMGA